MDIISYVKEFERTGKLARGCNPTSLTLLPKVSDPLTLHDYRPISLVGCQYKIVVELLANTLKEVLPHLI